MMGSSIHVTLNITTYVLVFYQRNCTCTIERMIFYYCRISTFMFFSHIFCVFLVTALHAKVYCVACGNADVIQYMIG